MPGAEVMLRMEACCRPSPAESTGKGAEGSTDQPEPGHLGRAGLPPAATWIPPAATWKIIRPQRDPVEKIALSDWHLPPLVTGPDRSGPSPGGQALRNPIHFFPRATKTGCPGPSQSRAGSVNQEPGGIALGKKQVPPHSRKDSSVTLTATTHTAPAPAALVLPGEKAKPPTRGEGPGPLPGRTDPEALAPS